MKLIDRFTIRSALTLATLATLGAGCGDEAAESFSYDFSTDSCTTGSHTFTSKTAYCDGLLSDKLNNGCAYTLRRASYSGNCGGDFDAAWARINRSESTESDTD